jgi:hypothetical protein
MVHLLPKRRHQPCKLKQVFQTERRPAGRDHHHRIRRNHVCPTGWNGGQLLIPVTVADPVLAPVVTNGYERELLAVERMERMGDAECLCRIVPIGCI